MAFKRKYIDIAERIGYEAEDDTWLLARIEGDEIYIDKLYLSSEPALSIKQARKFADKILDFCDKIEQEQKS